MLTKFSSSLALLVALTGVSSSLYAANNGGDYARIQVPQMSQAVSFFENVLGCAPLDADNNNPQSQLLQCAQDTVLELHVGSSAQPQPASRIYMHVNDTAAAIAALRSKQLEYAAQAPRRGLLAIDFSTPWGQSIELTGYAPRAASVVPPNDRIASE